MYPEMRFIKKRNSINNFFPDDIRNFCHIAAIEVPRYRATHEFCQSIGVRRGHHTNMPGDVIECQLIRLGGQNIIVFEMFAYQLLNLSSGVGVFFNAGIHEVSRPQILKNLVFLFFVNLTCVVL